MDRRDFLKALLASPLAVPLLPALRSGEATSTLYLIADDPQDYLPSIAAEMEKAGLVQGRRLAIRDPYPFAPLMKRALVRAGWECVDAESAASVTLTFRALHQPVLPSFTLIQNGRIRDLRSTKLGRLWRELNGRHSPTTALTIASFREPAPPLSPGWSAAVFVDGSRREVLPLNKDRERRYRTLRGEVLIRIQGGQAEVLASSCRHKICQASAPASLAGEQIVCAPNHFLLTIDGPRFVDTVTG